jgi:heme/copper-type cytochrome/quinol oxidase subunit 2
MSDLSQQVLQKVKTTKPYTKLHFQLLTMLLMLLITIVVVGAVTATTLNFWDLSRQFNGGGRIRQNQQLAQTIWSTLTLIILEIIVIVSLCSGLIYFLYRKTNWFLVKNRSLLIAAILGVILIGGTTGWLIVENHQPTQRYFDQLEKKLEKIGRRRNRPMQPLLNLENK